MSYLGSSAAPLPVAFAGVNGQSFNGGANTFTLSRSVGKTTDIELVVNNVQQNPYDGSYSVSGNVLTTAESVSAGVANVYVGYRDAPLGSFSPIAGSVLPSSMSTGAPTWNANSQTTIPGLVGGGIKDSAAPGIYFDKQTSSSESYIPFARAEGDSTTTHLAIGASSTSGEARVYAGGGQRIVAKPNGQVSLPMGQLSFPATQNASSDANTLDDYEEGTFTPVVYGGSTNGSGTYTVQRGTYVKVGRQVTVIIALNWSGHTGTGYLGILGLPFIAVDYCTAAVDFGGLTVVAGAIPISEHQSGATNIIMIAAPTGGGGTAAISMDAAASLYFSYSYITNQ